MERRKPQIKDGRIPQVSLLAPSQQNRVQACGETSVTTCRCQQSLLWVFHSLTITKPHPDRKTQTGCRNLASSLWPFLLYPSWVDGSISRWIHIWLPRHTVWVRAVCGTRFWMAEFDSILQVQGPRPGRGHGPGFANNHMWLCINHFTFQGANFLILNRQQVSVFLCGRWLG